MAMSLLFQRWTETIGLDNSGTSFKQRCELYHINEKDELRIRELERTHRLPITVMIKGNLDESITELGKRYGFSSQERVKWSQFFLGHKLVYESMCPSCNQPHIHYSKINASLICDICTSPRCIQCSKHYFPVDNELPAVRDGYCSLRCSTKAKQKENIKHFFSFWRRKKYQYK